MTETKDAKEAKQGVKRLSALWQLGQFVKPYKGTMIAAARAIDVMPPIMTMPTMAARTIPKAKE